LQDLARPRDPLGLQGGHGNHRVHEPHAERLGGSVAPAQEPDLTGLLLADHARKVARAKSAVEAAHGRPDLAEHGVLRRDRQVADDMEHVTAPDRVTRHERDHDLRHRPDQFLEIEDIEPGDPIAPDVPRPAAHALVAPGAKGVFAVGMGAGARQENHPDPHVVARVAKGLD
jgi:hypothetical protein